MPKNPPSQYRALLQEILDHGVRVQTAQEVDALTVMGPKPMHFKLSEGFPMITERKMSEKIWKQAIGEIIAFINGARTLTELESYGCNWWQAWGTPEKAAKRGLEVGDLGPGSYGAAFADFPTKEGEGFNQFAMILQQMRERPELRTHFISPWVPQYTIRVKGRQQKVLVCPCHGWIHLRIIDNKLTLHMFQRSADVPIGVPSNMIEYGALTMMIAQALGLEAYEYIHSFSDAHIYVDQVDKVKEMLEREARPLPKMSLNPEKTDLFSFRVEDFTLSDYQPHPGIWDIPVAV
jgi:thymidylate synthase